MASDGAPLDLEAIRKRLVLATPGPWYRVGPPWNDGQPWINAGSEDPHRKRFICDLADMADWDDEENTRGRSITGDADFIAAARSDVPALLAEVERLNQEIVRLRAGHADMVQMHADAVAKADYWQKRTEAAWERGDERAVQSIYLHGVERDVIEAARRVADTMRATPFAGPIGAALRHDFLTAVDALPQPAAEENTDG